MPQPSSSPPSSAGFRALKWLRPNEDLELPLGWTPGESEYSSIIDGCVEHRVWFNDYIWNAGPERRRTAVTQYLADAYINGRVWHILRGDQIVGIFLLNRVQPGVEGYPHFVFFDHELRNKRELCRKAMMTTFEDPALALHALRVELPRYAGKLSGFLRKALGFKFEAERCLSDVSLAKRASRRHEAVLYEDSWQDVLLLSVTRREFEDHVKSRDLPVG